MKQLMIVVGARPNFVKIAPLVEELSRAGWAEMTLVHTGQHYDRLMSDAFFEDLEIPEPDVNLGVGSASHAEQLASIMQRFEPVLTSQTPDAVVVVGDVNSTIATSIISSRYEIPVIHIEAGLRSFDRSMPEEINRILTDQIASLLFVSEPSGMTNLEREGISPDKSYLVGNIMIDTLLNSSEKVGRRRIVEQVGLTNREYALATFHRPANVDSMGAAIRLVACIGAAHRHMPTVIPMHPRSRHSLEKFGLLSELLSMENARIIDPIGYLDFIALQRAAQVVLTDSGGVQEESTVLGVPCLTMRENTERPITVELGTSTLVGLDAEQVDHEIRLIIEGGYKTGQRPPLWDGGTAKRIVDIMATEL